MKIEYTILALFVGLMFAVVRQYLPDFPLADDVLLGLFVYVLGKLGVEVVGKPVRAFLVKRGLL